MGNKNGRVTTYYSTGEKKKEQQYLLDELYGTSTWYKKSGEKEKERVYYDNRILTETVY